MLGAMRLLTAYLAAAALAGCSSSESAGGGTGGASPSNGGSTGGVTSNGGSTGAGASTGGVAVTGGSPSFGGSVASGGQAPASGGITSTGGKAQTEGGSSGNAGQAAGGGGTTGGSLASGGGGIGGAASGGGGGTAGSNGGSGGSSGAPSTCPPAMKQTGGQQICMNQTGNAGSGYSYELWAEGPGKGCMTVFGKDATFSATWTGVEDLLARVGLSFDRTRTHQQIGTITANFAETKTGSDGLVYVGIYGWTVEPLREYYILDDWGETKPAGTASDGTPRDFVGTFSVDGGTYDIWKKTRVDKPAITGPSETFDQYFSIRQTARQCGRISISEHFKKFEELGLPFGKLTEAKILMEAQDSSGTIEFTTATVEVD